MDEPMVQQLKELQLFSGRLAEVLHPSDVGKIIKVFSEHRFKAFEAGYQQGRVEAELDLINQ